MISVLIVDDQNLARESLKLSLDKETDIKVVGAAKTGAEALILAKELKPDIVLMDINMPGMDGLEATQKINNLQLGIKFIFLSADDISHFQTLVYSRSAGNYLSKNSLSAELVERIKLTYRQYGTQFPKTSLHTRPSISTVGRANDKISEFMKDSPISNTTTKDTIAVEGVQKRSQLFQNRPTKVNIGYPDLEEVIVLLKQKIGEFDAKAMTLFNRYNDISYKIRSNEEKNDRFLARLDTILQKNRSINTILNKSSNNLFISIVRLEREIAGIGRQLQLFAYILIVALTIILLLLFVILLNQN